MNSASDIAKQIVSPDRKRRLTICHRDDGLFFYREDTFEEWDDAPHVWLEGYPPSGLFSSVNEAETEARSTIHWLREMQ